MIEVLECEEYQYPKHKCAGCHKTTSDIGSIMTKEGYEWICRSCFKELRK